MKTLCEQKMMSQERPLAQSTVWGRENGGWPLIRPLDTHCTSSLRAVLAYMVFHTCALHLGTILGDFLKYHWKKPVCVCVCQSGSLQMWEQFLCSWEDEICLLEPKSSSWLSACGGWSPCMQIQECFMIAIIQTPNRHYQRKNLILCEHYLLELYW